MNPRLPESLLRLPIAHRALHGVAGPENSRAAIRAAIEHGYGIEIDLQLSADGNAMVFHDYNLDRLTNQSGFVNKRTAAELADCLLNGTEEGIPTLSEVLSLVQGRAPLLIEIKDQDGAMGPSVGPLEEAAVTALEGYKGAYALMSFNPHSVACLADCAPHIPRGLVTSAYQEADWQLPPELCKRLRQIDEIDRIGASFISHEASDLSRPRVADLKAQGLDVLCWTVRSPDAEAVARRVAQNVTFEGYLSEIPG